MMSLKDPAVAVPRGLQSARLRKLARCEIPCLTARSSEVMMGIEKILNFIQIDDLTASGGQPSETEFQDARNAGYDLVINLAPDGLATSLADEATLLESMD